MTDTKTDTTNPKELAALLAGVTDAAAQFIYSDKCTCCGTKVEWCEGYEPKNGLRICRVMTGSDDSVCRVCIYLWMDPHGGYDPTDPEQLGAASRAFQLAHPGELP